MNASILLAFALVALGMVLTPGPNMVYLISRSVSQGHTAGLISLGGVALAFLVYLLCAASRAAPADGYHPRGFSAAHGDGSTALRDLNSAKVLRRV
jgi:hypothetical protein